jgi:poly(A) polymerase
MTRSHDHDDATTSETTAVGAETAPESAAPVDAAPGGETTDDAPRVINEAAWAEAHDDDDADCDDEPLHFGAVASDDEGGDATDDDAEEVDDDAAAAGAAVAARPELEITLNADAEIPLASIDEDALWVVKRLRAKGFEAYLTGGCVRDLLLGRQPKDFDVATAAHPNQVRAVFRNCRLVGRRFRLAHVFFQSGKVIETATFRANPTDTLEDLPEDLLVARDNVFGTVEEDARRRDLTINGLFYDPVAGKVLDFVNGRADLDARLIRTIGDPDIRFQEDPVRILRAIKFAARLGFAIEPNTLAAMERHTASLLRCAHARLQEEILRLLASTHARASFDMCDQIGVTRVLLPELLEDIVVPAPSPATAPTTDGGAEVAADTSSVAADDTGSAADAVVAPTVGDGAAADSAAVDSSGAVTADTANTAEAAVAEAAVVSTAADRRSRFLALLDALDEVRRRDADITSALALAVLVTPVWETLRGTPGAFDAWWHKTADAFTERLRLTRHDRERIPQLLQAQIDLEPARRRGHHARATVSRPSFREALLLLIIRLQAAQQPLDEVAAWKVVAAAYNQAYQQARYDRNRQRAAGRGAGGSDRGRGGRGRDRDRGDRSRGRGNGGRRRGR